MKSRKISLQLLALHLVVLAGVLLMQGCATGQCPIDAFNWPYNEPTLGPAHVADTVDFPADGSDSILLPPMIDTDPGVIFDPPAVPAVGDTYVVRKGDTLSAIASMYGTSWKKLAALNNLSNANKLLVGQEIVIPSGLNASSSRVTRPAAGSSKPITEGTTYVIQRGDTLSGIASRAGVTIAELKAANAMSSNRIIAGKSLTIPKEGVVLIKVAPSAPAKLAPVKDAAPELAPIVGLKPLAPAGSAPVYEHVLYPGETLEDVARQYGSLKKEIMLLNGITDPSTLKPGTKLLVPIPE